MRRLGKGLKSFFSSSRKLNNAIDYLENGREKEAFTIFAALAGKGEESAQYYVGLCYLRGQGTPHSLEEGARWLYRVAKAGHVDACFILATLYLKGFPEGFDPSLLETFSLSDLKKEPQNKKIDHFKALEWASLAAKKSHPDAQALVGWILTYGDEALRDVKQARQWYERAAHNGAAQGYYGYGLILLNEAKNNKDYEKAARLFRKAVEKGVIVAYTTLGWMYERGCGFAPNIKRAGYCYKKAAEEKIAPAQFRYGLMLLKGIGVDKNIVQAESYLRAAAHNGVADAAAMLGDLYINGDVFLSNIAEGFKWYEAAAELGHAGAARALAIMYYCGSGTWPDSEKAIYWFNRAAEGGDSYANADLGNLILGGGEREEDYSDDLRIRLEKDAESGDQLAAFNLGVCLANGLGCDKDCEKALYWFKQALSGIVNAQYWYGRIILESSGRLGAPAEGLKWIEKAAEEGMADACAVLAQIFVTGQFGIEKDHQKALELYMKAAEQGSIDALFSLGALYGGGHDVEEDLPKAQEYFEKAAHAGHALSQMMLGNYLLSGRGGRKDQQEAMQWIERAAEQGLAEAQEMVLRLRQQA